MEWTDPARQTPTVLRLSRPPGVVQPGAGVQTSVETNQIRLCGKGFSFYVAGITSGSNSSLYFIIFLFCLENLQDKILFEIKLFAGRKGRRCRVVKGGCVSF